MTRKFGLILCFFYFGFSLFAQNEDCELALDLVQQGTRLDTLSIRIDTLRGFGNPDNITGRPCNGPIDPDPTAPPPEYFTPEDRSFWFSFSAATAGTFEMLINPDNLEGDFDFAIWEGSCPSNPCSVPVFCGWNGPLGTSFVPTGLSSDLTIRATNLEVWAPITLKENTNYYVLIDHRRPFDPSAPYPEIGGDITFGGTALIGPTREAPILLPSSPADTIQSISIGCPGTSREFEVDLRNSEEIVEYIWETPSGDIITSNDEEQFLTLQQSGQVCVSINCPVQETVCWDVEVFEQPQLEILTPITTSCDPLTIEDYVRDTSGAPDGPFLLLNDQSQIVDNANINIRGNYTISKINGICPGSIPISITPPIPELVPTSIATCDALPINLNAITITDQIDELNGFKAANNLAIIFFEDSLQAVDNVVMPITMATRFGTYWARGFNANDCFDVVPIEIFDAAPAINSPILPATCNQFDLTTVDLRMANGMAIDPSQISYFDNLTNTSDPSNALSSPIVNSSGTYIAQIRINPTCSSDIPLDVVVNQNPTIDPVAEIDFCTEFNLEDVSLETNGTIVERDYFNSEADANAIIGLPIDPIVNAADIYWVKGTDLSNNCFSVVPVTLVSREPTINTVAPVNECDSFDLNTLVSILTEASGTILDYSFYETEAEAEAGISPILGNITTSDTYYIRGVNTAITNSVCFDVQTVDVTITSLNIPASNLVLPAACNQFDLTSVDLGISINPSQISYFENTAAASDPSNALTNPIVNNSGTYIAQIRITPTCSSDIPLNVVINQNPIIDPVADIEFCSEFNLEDVNLETNGTIVERDYFNSEADANAIIGLPIDPIVNAADIYWVKGTDLSNNCFSVVPVNLVSREPTINTVAPINECDVFDLNNLAPILTEATGTILDYSFYETAAAAEAGTSPISGNITTSDTYYIRGVNTAVTNSICFDVQSVDITLTTPNIREITERKIRNGEFDLSEVDIINLDNPLQVIIPSGYFRDSAQTQALPSPIVTVDDTYWVGFTVGGCSISRPVIVRPASNATFPQQTIPVDFPCTKEDGINVDFFLLATTGSVDTLNFTIEFFNEEDDAEKGINAIPSTDLFIQEEGSIWVRRSDIRDNNTFGLIELVLTERATAAGGIVSMDQDICAVDTLAFQFTGSAPFDVRYTDGTDTFDLVVPSTDLVEEIVSPTSTTTYSIVSIKDFHGCDGLLVNNEPTFTPVSISVTDPITECDDRETTYVVIFDVTSGDMATLSIDGGAMVGNRFISDPILITDTYSFMVTDRNHSATGDCDPLVIESDTPPVCSCDTEAAVMDPRTITACVGMPVTAIVNQPAVIADNNDRTVYVLHDSDNEQLGNIIDINSDEPSFTFTPDLAGNRYYISAVTTFTTDLLQTPTLQSTENRCLAVAPGSPVDVRALPSLTISLEKDSSCFGESVDLIFEMPEDGPYNLSLFDGDTTINLTNVQNGDTRTVNAEMTTIFEVTSISYSDFSTCVNDMPDAMATLEVLAPITILNTMVNCEDDGENFRVSFEIVGGDPTTYTVDRSSANINGNLFESDFIANETNFQFLVDDGNGCMSVEVSDIGKCDCTSDITATIEVLQEISCPNERDGALSVTGNNGELPYSFEWSTGSTTEQTSALGAGVIFVSMTDANLCEVVDSFNLTDPDPITAMVSFTDPTCSDLENGSILINNVQGGTRPYRYTLDGGETKSVGLFANLAGNDYSILIEDNRGCQYEETTTITTPSPLNIWFAQSEFNLVFGDSLDLRVNANEDSLTYAWQSHPSLSCINCPSPLVRPTETTNYTVTVTNNNDCTISSDILVQVDNDKSLFSPTAFSPNGDGINDTFGLFGGSQVREIVRLEVFNRWGALLYSRTNLPITDNFEDGWDGNETNGEEAPSGIYVYIAEIIYTDGTSEVITGDVALMR